jgi:hypothetical protein
MWGQHDLGGLCEKWPPEKSVGPLGMIVRLPDRGERPAWRDVGPIGMGMKPQLRDVGTTGRGVGPTLMLSTKRTMQINTYVHKYIQYSNLNKYNTILIFGC